MNKPTAFLGVAHQISMLGTCDRALVGAVIVKEGRCISWGYNGAPPGAPHCADNNHGWGDDPLALAVGCRNATHAEANAIAFAARQGISTDGCTLYVTVSPCDVCARLLVAAGIISVIYANEYRDHAGLDVLRQAGVGYGKIIVDG